MSISNTGFPPSSNSMILNASILSYRSLKTYLQKLLCLDRELHREFGEHLACITVHNKSYGLFRAYSSLVAVEKLILADL